MRRADRVVAVVLLVFSGLVYGEAGNFSTDAAMFPRLVAILTAILAIFLGGMSFLRTSEDSSPRPSGGESRVRAKRVALLLGGAVVYLAVVTFVGHILATLLFLPALMFPLGVRRPVFILLTTLAVAGAIWGVFDLGLRVPIPRGILFD